MFTDSHYAVIASDRISRSPERSEGVAIRHAVSLRGAAEAIPVRFLASLGMTFQVRFLRRLAQPLGIHLDAWKRRIIKIEKGVVRLLPVTERAGQLFGKEGASAVADRIEREPTCQMQLTLPSTELRTGFSDAATAPEVKVRGRRKKRETADLTDEGT